MKTDYHVHCTYCDGKNTPREIVEAALSYGMHAIGFSSHAYTPGSHCGMTPEGTEDYIAEVTALKAEYAGKMQIYLGTEEDMRYEIDRSRYDYIIGSKHFYLVDGTYYSIDSNPDRFARSVEVFGGGAIAMANTYYTEFCEYIERRKPDIIGHFDLLTKFDEKSEVSRFLRNQEYCALADGYARRASRVGCLFEVNTGAISRGFRTNPYPSERLLHVLKKEGAGFILTSDSHRTEHIMGAFDEARDLLRRVGIPYVYVLYDGTFQKDYL